MTIKSIFNGVDEEIGDYRVLPVENIQPVQTALQGDFGPITDEMARFVAVEGAGILAGMGIVGFAQKVARNRINKNLKDTASDLEAGLLPGEKKRRSDAFFSLDTAKDIGFTTLGAASGEAAVKFTALASGAVPETDEEGNIVEPAVQPDMTFTRALKASFALFSASAMVLDPNSIGINFISPSTSITKYGLLPKPAYSTDITLALSFTFGLDITPIHLFYTSSSLTRYSAVTPLSGLQNSNH